MDSRIGPGVVVLVNEPGVPEWEGIVVVYDGPVDGSSWVVANEHAHVEVAVEHLTVSPRQPRRVYMTPTEIEAMRFVRSYALRMPRAIEARVQGRWPALTGLAQRLAYYAKKLPDRMEAPVAPLRRVEASSPIAITDGQVVAGWWRAVPLRDTLDGETFLATRFRLLAYPNGEKAR